MKFAVVMTLLLMLQVSQAFGLAWPKRTLEPFQKHQTFGQLFECPKYAETYFCKEISKLKIGDKKLPAMAVETADTITLTEGKAFARVKLLDDLTKIQVNGKQIQLSKDTTAEQLFQEILKSFPKGTASLIQVLVPSAQAQTYVEAEYRTLVVAMTGAIHKNISEKSCRSSLDILMLCTQIYSNLKLANLADFKVVAAQKRSTADSAENTQKALAEAKDLYAQIQNFSDHLNELTDQLEIVRKNGLIYNSSLRNCADGPEIQARIELQTACNTVVKDTRDGTAKDIAQNKNMYTKWIRNFTELMRFFNGERPTIPTFSKQDWAPDLNTSPASQ